MGNQHLKQLGEDIAEARLKARGMHIVARNWRIGLGELDLVALDETTLVFCEVKTRGSSRFAEPFLSVGSDKQRRIRRLAEAFIAFERVPFETARFDVISVTVDSGEIRHLVNAF